MSAEQEVIKPWERQPDEGEEAFAAFDMYAKLGDKRSIRKVSEEIPNASGGIGKDPSLLERWSRRWLWVTRAAAWDRFLAREANEAIVIGRAEMRQRHILNAKNLQTQVGRRIFEMTARELGQLKPRELAALLRTATEIERKAREVSVAELESGKSDFAPTFIIEFVPSKPPEMLQVRMADGRAGFIPPQMKDRFFEDHPDAVVVQFEGDHVPTQVERQEQVL